MNIRNIIFCIICIVAFATGCDDTKISTDLGTGSITYNNQTYSLNFLTMYTYSSNDNDTFNHNAVITSTKNGNIVFSFSIKDDNSKNEINRGNYNITINGDYTARFSIDDAADSLSGTMKISIDEDNYTFDFAGKTVDENSDIKDVIFTYSGKIRSEEKP